MDTQMHVFICHKKELISGGSAGQQYIRKTVEAGILHFLLKQQRRYDPWVDDSELAAGVEWEKAIYARLLASDVLIVLIGPGTSDSEWVRREIALAQALGIAIVPLGFDVSGDELVAEMKALGIDHIQGITTKNLKLTAGDALLTELRPQLDQALARTLEQQTHTLEPLISRRKQPRPKAADNQRAASFTLAKFDLSTRIHVASGDIARVKDVDVFVNSENDYMQMARFFESRTVSSTLRRLGARVRDGRYEDTIQQELDWQLRARGRPVQAGEVFVTSAGGPDSELAHVNKARHLFHVAAVQAVPAENRVVPFQQPEQIERCVRVCLEKIGLLNATNGVVSPDGTPQHAHQQALAKQGKGGTTSIVFPLFGTGQGGSQAGAVVQPMLSAITQFLQEPDSRGAAEMLEDIYLCVYAQEDAETIIGILRTELG